jgi:hypothetical protein
MKLRSTLLRQMMENYAHCRALLVLPDYELVVVHGLNENTKIVLRWSATASAGKLNEDLIHTKALLHSLLTQNRLIFHEEKSRHAFDISIPVPGSEVLAAYSFRVFMSGSQLRSCPHGIVLRKFGT